MRRAAKIAPHCATCTCDKHHRLRPIDLKCTVCHKPFPAKRKDAKTCSDACRQIRSYWKRYHEKVGVDSFLKYQRGRA